MGNPNLTGKCTAVSGRIYFRDPNGYVIELTADTDVHGEIMDPARSKPHAALARWQAEKNPA